MGIPDPAKAAGTEEQIMAVFRAVRDEITHSVPALLRQWNRKEPNKEVDPDVKEHRSRIG